MTGNNLRENWPGRNPTQEQLEQERQELEEAGWEHVEDALGKSFWRNPDSGYLYPQAAAVSIVRGENVADGGGEETL